MTDMMTLLTMLVRAGYDMKVYKQDNTDRPVVKIGDRLDYCVTIIFDEDGKLYSIGIEST